MAHSTYTSPGPDQTQTRITRSRYQRLAPFYDRMETFAERRYVPWRRRVWEALSRNLHPGASLLEVGVGTGKNMLFWPRGVDITAIDLTPGMLQRAEARHHALGLSARLELGDAQAMRFSDRYFDGAVATFVFCSVPDPVRGLRELRRVVRPGGSVVLLEHVRSSIPWLGGLMDLINPLVVRVMGANINRDTVGNVALAGLVVERVDELGSAGIFKLIQAHVPQEDDIA